MHMFYNCTYTQLFWKEVSTWLKTFQVALEPLIETHVLFGVTNHKQFSPVDQSHNFNWLTINICFTVQKDQGQFKSFCIKY